MNPNIIVRYIRVAAFVRVSTSKQAQIQHGSLDQQKNAIFDYIKRLNAKDPTKFYEVVQFIEEDVSGKSDQLHKRKDLSRVEKLIKSGQIDAVIIEKLDRLSRNQRFNSGFVETLAENGCEFHEVESGQIDFRKRDHRFSFFLRNYQAEDYSLELSEKKIRKGQLALFHDGKDSSTYATLGLAPHPSKTCFYVKSEADAPIFHAMKNYFFECESLTMTAQLLNKNGYHTKTRILRETVDRYGNRKPMRTVEGKRFTADYVRTVLTSSRIRSIKRFIDLFNQFPERADENGIVTCGLAHQSLLSDEEISKIDSILMANKKHYSPNDDLLLREILQNADGKNYTGDSSLKTKGRIKKKYLYYEDIGGPDSPFKRINATDFEKEIISRVKKYLSSSEIFEELFKSNTEFDSFEKEVRERVKVIKEEIKIKNKMLNNLTEKMRSFLTSEQELSKEVLFHIASEKSQLQLEITNSQASLIKAEKNLAKICDGNLKKSFRDGLSKLLQSFDMMANCDKIKVLRSILGIYSSRWGNNLNVRPC